MDNYFPCKDGVWRRPEWAKEMRRAEIAKYKQNNTAREMGIEDDKGRVINTPKVGVIITPKER
eukprot:1231461-Heterocapsa_arctica.AAC.1